MHLSFVAAWDKTTAFPPNIDGGQGLIDPTFSSGNQSIPFDPHFFTCTKHVYCRVWITIMHHQCHSLSTLRFTHTCMSCNHCMQHHKRSAHRTLKTFTGSTMNASRLAHLPFLHFHQDLTDKIDLNDLCQTFVSSRPKEREESLFG